MKSFSAALTIVTAALLLAAAPHGAGAVQGNATAAAVVLPSEKVALVDWEILLSDAGTAPGTPYEVQVTETDHILTIAVDYN